MKNSLLAQLSAVTTSANASKNTPVKKASFESYISKLTPAQQAAMIEAKKAADLKKAAPVAQKAAPVAPAVVVHVPTNDRAGLYLYAYTAAVMALVKSLPVGQQATAARALHGSTAIAYHGKKGNIVIKGGAVEYRTNVLSCDPKSCTDSKRHGAFTFVGMFSALITSGALPTVKPEGFNWKALACRKVSI